MGSNQVIRQYLSAPRSLAVILVVLAFVVPGARADTLILASPKPRQIIQRAGGNRTDILVAGTWSGTAVRLEARAVVMPGNTNNGVSTGWTVIVNAPTNGVFAGVLPGVAAGGWYCIQVRAVDASTNVLISSSVARIGVGDVFVTAGQSNAACFGSPAQSPTDDRVSAFDIVRNAWQWAADPQPNPSGSAGAGGSPWPILGSLLAKSNGIPVGFVAVAWGSTAVQDWQPGSLEYFNLTNALRAFGPGGVRAVLWHQGESDSLAGTTAVAYALLLSNVVAQSRLDAGWMVPWGIAEVSFHPSATLDQEEPVAAGHRLFLYTSSNCFRGPRTDDFNLEGKVADGVHFNAAGLADHAQQWADALLGVEQLTPINRDFESNAPVVDGHAGYGRVIGWNQLNGTGDGAAPGPNGYSNPSNPLYFNTTDGVNGGVAPNMNGPQVGFLINNAAVSNAFLQTLRAHLQPSTIYTFQAAIGQRNIGGAVGGYRLDLLANGAPLGPGIVGDVFTLNALDGGSSTGKFTVVSCVVTSAVTVATNQQLAVRVTKTSGVNAYLDFDNVQVSSQLTAYGQWQMAHWGSLTDPESLPEADPDSDGLPNLIEFHLAGVDPKSFTPMPHPVLVQLNGEDYWQMQLLKNPAATTGTVGLRMSYDLAHWFTPDSSGNGDLIVLNDDVQFTVQLRRSTTPTVFFQIVAQF